MTIYQLAEWVYTHRRGRAFKGYTLERIIHELTKKIDAGCIRYVEEDGQITGVALFSLNFEKKEVEPCSTLTTSPTAIILLANEFIRSFDGWKFIVHHRGRRPDHDTKKYFQRLINLNRRTRI